MGVVHRPDDVLSRRKRLEIATRDMSSGVRDLVLNVIDSWSGLKSFEELKRLLGEEKARQIVEELGLSEE
ncbi:MAG: hypothetical protein ACUVQ0_05145 [Thermoproteota archaeon]